MQHQVKLRSPIGVFFLAVITGGIYYFYWFYRVNEEAAILSRDENANPALSLLAATVGWLLIVPPFVTHWRTAKRVGEATGQPPTLAALILLAGVPLWGVFYTWWVQGKLNKHGRRQRFGDSPAVERIQAAS